MLYAVCYSWSYSGFRSPNIIYLYPPGVVRRFTTGGVGNKTAAMLLVK